LTKAEEVTNHLESNTSSIKRSNERPVEFIMSCVKEDPTGIGKILNYHFYAPLDESNPSKPIVYINEPISDELELLMQ
jgi:hypothetical protein